MWDKIGVLIQEKKAKSYDEAIKILQNLKELSIHKKQVDGFYKKVEIIKQKYSRLSAFKSRLEKAKLVK